MKSLRRPVTIFRNSICLFVSGSLLFRAPGADRLESQSTLVDTAETRRDTMGQSFEPAMAGMTVNLDAELDRFKTRVTEEQVAVVTYKPGHEKKGGAGSMDLVVVLVVGACALAARRSPRRTNGCGCWSK